MVSIGAVLLIGSTLAAWWHVGGHPGELPARGDVGISDVRGLVVFLAAVACLLLATVRSATSATVRIDRPWVYATLLGMAAIAYVTRVADLAGQGLAPWPPAESVGPWVAAAGLTLLAGGVLALLRAGRAPRGGAVEAAADSHPESPQADYAPDRTTRPLLAPARLIGAWRRLLRPAALPDRSASLDAEPRGRPDKLDLWVMAGLVAAVLSMRLYGLGQPTQMYFDEVYHARTATEFLQEWRYGIHHDIYEWTHPMLAKYVMAGGIAAFSDDRVTATAQLGVTVDDAVVEERTAISGTGDRVFVATGSEVRAYDLQTRRLVHTYSIPGVSALSDPTPDGLIYAGARDGAVYVIATNSLDQLRADPKSSVAPATLLAASSGISITHVFAGAPPYVLVSDATGNVVSLDASDGAGSVVGRATIPNATAFAAFGTQPGSDAASTPAVLVAYRDGVAVLDARDLTIDSTAATDSPATSLALDPDFSGGAYRLYVTAGRSVLLLDVVPGSNPAISLETDQPLAKMPGAVSRVVFDEGTRIAHVLGRTTNGTGWTVYAIETNGSAVFSDAPLPFEPVAIALDNSVTQGASGEVAQMPQADREELLAFAPDGSMASVDVGQFAFSWRLPGVLFGALMAACLYLLARILFRRRSVGLLVAFFSLADGMLFAQSRIAMNDAYVGGLLLLAYLIFAVLWLQVPRNRLAFWLGMPLLGAILGLALASKWVAVFAIGSMVMLILIRSALGRLVTILSLAVGTGVLGWVSLTQTPDAPNFTFFGIMMAATALAAAASARHPIAWSRDEMRFAIAAPPVLGLAGPLLVAALLVPVGLPVDPGPLLTVAAAGGAAGLGVGLIAGAGFRIAGRVGLGPLATVSPPSGDPTAPDAPAEPILSPSPAPQGWLRPGWGFGIPAVWTIVCVAVLPFVIYVALYIPWAMPWQSQVASGSNATGALPAIACWQVDQSTGTCADAWPAGHTGQTLWDLTVQMYDYHNDLRASHPASSPWWAWPLDLKPVWFESGSNVAGTSSAIYDGGNVVLWWLAVAGIAFVSWQALRRRSLGLGLVAAAFFWQWIGWSRVDRATFEYHFYTALPFFLLGLAYFLAELWHGPSRRTWLLARAALAGVLLLPTALWLLRPALCGLAHVDTGGNFGNAVCGTATGDFGLPSALVPVLAAAGILGSFVSLTARNPRRFVVGVCALAALFFAFDYPDLAALWLPSSVQPAYAALSPTWLYGFQFSTNLHPSAPVQIIGIGSIALVVVAMLVSSSSAWLARRR